MSDEDRLLPAQALRLAGNVLNLSTAFGLVVARVGGARLHRGPRGLLLADGYRLPFPIASAFTIGNVLITAGSWRTLASRAPRMLLHEERHAWQWLAFGGLPFLPVYLLGMLWSVLRAGDRASRNPFERLAGLEDGGYRT